MEIINIDHCISSHSKKQKQPKLNQMSSYKSQPLATKQPLRKRTSSATQTLLSLYLGPNVHIDFVLQVQTPEMKKQEEERREKVKQAKKEEKERQEKEEREERERKEKREKEIASLKKFSTGYKMAPRNYG